MRFLLPILLLFLSFDARAGVISRLTDFQPNTKAEADEVDAEFDQILSTINGNLDTNNFSDSGIATADLGSGVVTNVKIASYTITKFKQAGFTPDVSSEFSETAILNGDFLQIASATITAFGRPIFIGLAPQSAASTDTAYLEIKTTADQSNYGTEANAKLLLTRVGGGAINHLAAWETSTFAAASRDITSGGGNTNMIRNRMAPGQFWTIDNPGYGTWRYVIHVGGVRSQSQVTLSNLKMIVMEF